MRYPCGYNASFLLGIMYSTYSYFCNLTLLWCGLTSQIVSRSYGRRLGLHRG